jgi:hypothetical protein
MIKECRTCKFRDKLDFNHFECLKYKWIISKELETECICDE